MLKNILKSVKKKAHFGVENAISAPRKVIDNIKLKQLQNKQEQILNSSEEPRIKKLNMKEVSGNIQKISERNKDRLTRLKAIDYYTK